MVKIINERKLTDEEIENSEYYQLLKNSLISETLLKDYMSDKISTINKINEACDNWEKKHRGEIRNKVLEKMTMDDIDYLEQMINEERKRRNELK